MNPKGFTLLEILLVIIIIGIMTVAGVNMLNSQSIERQIMNDASAFEQHLTFLCEKSILENRALGLELNQTSYMTFQYQRQSWQVLNNLAQSKLSSEVGVELLLDGLPQKLPVEPAALPQLVCQTDGSINAFELRLSALGAENYYVLKTISPWQFEAYWHES